MACEHEQGYRDGAAFVGVVIETVDVHAAYLRLLARWPEPGIADCLASEHHLGLAALLPATACMAENGASREYLAAFSYGFAHEWRSV